MMNNHSIFLPPAPPVSSSSSRRRPVPAGGGTIRARPPLILVAILPYIMLSLPSVLSFLPTSNNGRLPFAVSSQTGLLVLAGKSSNHHDGENYFNNKNNNDNNNDDGYNNSGNEFDKDSALLQERLQRLRLDILEEELSRPPTNTALNPIQVVEAVMKGLQRPYDPLPDSGFRLLLQTASPKWRKAIVQSVGGATSSSSSSSDSPWGMELIASALGSSMARPHNQFAILVGEGEDYVLDFSGAEPLDFDDGTCWVECRLRDRSSGKLLVITGWDLVRQQQQQLDDDSNGANGAWMVDWIYWHDFRDEFRPGIGQEEWLLEVQ